MYIETAPHLFRTFGMPIIALFPSSFLPFFPLAVGGGGDHPPKPFGTRMHATSIVPRERPVFSTSSPTDKAQGIVGASYRLLRDPDQYRCFSL